MRTVKASRDALWGWTGYRGQNGEFLEKEGKSYQVKARIADEVDAQTNLGQVES